MQQRLLGRLDAINHGVIEGWAVDSHDEDSRSSTIEIVIDGAVVGRTRAALYRSDLQDADIRGGYAKFRFRVPEIFLDGLPHVVAARFAGTANSLSNSPIEFRSPAAQACPIGDRRRWALETLVLQDATREERFGPAIRQARRLALVSTYHNGRSFMLYHRSLFSALSEAGFVVVVVHASTGLDECLDTRLGPSCFTIVKRNVGYDFGSWAVGSFVIDSLMEDVDELLLLNDSFVELQAGTLGGLIERCRSKKADVVGVTDSYERLYHLQSYFVWCGPTICRSGMLQQFFSEYSFSSNKDAVIEEGELALTQRIMDAGFAVACLHPYEEVAAAWLANVDRVVSDIHDLPDLPSRAGVSSYKDGLFERLDRVVDSIVNGRPVNQGHFLWDTLITEFGCNLLKREFAFVNPCQVPTHFRLGQVLARLPDAKLPLADLRRRYGGDLAPALCRVGTDAKTAFADALRPERDAPALPQAALPSLAASPEPCSFNAASVGINGASRLLRTRQRAVLLPSATAGARAS